jgi:HK97 family phage portal protein
MGMLARLASWYRGKSASSEDDLFLAFGEFNRSATGVAVTQWKALQENTVLSCVSIRSIDFAKLPGHVYNRRADGGKEIAANHPLERLLRAPNDWQNWLEFAEQMQVAFLLRNNAYAPIIRNGRGIPTKLVPVNPDRVSLYESPDGSLFYLVARQGQHEIAALSSLPIMVPAEDMLHLRGLSMDGLTGLSRIGMMRETIGLSLAQEMAAAKLYGNGARPGGVLQTDKKLGPDTITRLKAQWQQNYGGLENSGKTAVLEEGLKWQALSMTSLEAQTLESRRFEVERIARAFDLPPHRLGLSPHGGGPAILQAHQMYLNNTISADAERWERKLEHIFDLDGVNQFVEFDLDYFNRADEQTRMVAGRTGVIGTLISPNEWRNRNGYPSKPKGDDLLQPTNVAPLGTAPSAGSSGPGSDVTGQPAPGGDGDPAAVPTQ